MQRKFSFRDKLSYAFDSMMSKGTSGLIIWLGVLSVILILVFSVAVLVTNTAPDEKGFVKMIWMSLMRTLDPGTMEGDEGSVFFLLVMLCVTLGGIFMKSTLIGMSRQALKQGSNRCAREDPE